jgi:hypothetical protein
MNGPVDQSEIHELDQRTGDGFDVTLLWSSRTGKVFVAVEDARTSDSFHFAVDPSDALDAFRHPYAYSRRQSLSTRPRSAPSTATATE